MKDESINPLYNFELLSLKATTVFFSFDSENKWKTIYVYIFIYPKERNGSYSPLFSIEITACQFSTLAYAQITQLFWQCNIMAKPWLIKLISSWVAPIVYVFHYKNYFEKYVIRCNKYLNSEEGHRMILSSF